MESTVGSGPAKVLLSGMATCFMAHPLEVTLEHPARLVLVFTFASDPTVADVAVSVDARDDRWTIQCVNFDKPDGRGTSQPTLLGEFGSVLLFLHFRVFRFGQTEDRTVHYTVYGVDKEDVGWTPG